MPAETLRRPVLYAGVFVWLLSALGSVSGLTDIGLIELIVLLAVFLVIPLGMWVASFDHPPIAFLGAALAVLPAFQFATGAIAGVFTIPWLALAWWTAGRFAWRWVTAARPCFDPEAIGAIAAVSFVGVSASFLSLSRFGIEPPGIGEPIVLLTAVHFAFAGFATSVIAIRLYRKLSPVMPKTCITTIGLAVCAPPVVALGFETRMAVFQVGGALLMTLTVWLCSIMTALRLVPSVRGWPRILFAISAAVVWVSMFPALIWTVAQYVSIDSWDIATIARTHGTLNGFGFSLCGLLGWAALDERHSKSSTT